MDASETDPVSEDRSAHHGRFLRRVAQTAGANAITMALVGSAGLYLAHHLEATGRGQYAAIQSWYGILTIIGEAGLTASTCYYVARHRSEAASWLATSRNTLFCLGALTGALGVALSSVLAARTDAPLAGYLLAFSILPITFVAGSWTYALQATHTRRWNMARLSNAVAYAAIILVLGLFGELTVVLAVQALAASVFFQTLISWRLAKRTLGSGTADRSKAGQLLAYGLRSLAGTAPFAFNARIDQVLLTFLVTSSELGNYAVAVTLTMVATPLATAFGSVIMPWLAQGSSQSDPRLIRTALRGSFAAGILVISPLVILSPLIVPALLGDSFSDVPALLTLLAPGAVLLGCNQVLGDILRGMGRPLDVGRSEAVGLATTALLLLLLVRSFGGGGAAIASSTAYAVSFVLLHRQVKRAGSAAYHLGEPA